MMKRIISVLSKLITVQSLLVLAIVLCIWSILAIQLDVSFLILNVGWEQYLCDKINSVYVNLSYSFIAGYIFYILTIYVPQRINYKKIQPVLIKKVQLLKSSFRNVLLEFSRDVNVSDFMEIESARQVLLSKDWTSYIPMFQLLYKANLSYIEYINIEGKSIKQQILDFIQTYQQFLTTEQICALEELSSMHIFRIASQFSQMNINLQPGINSLIDEFILALEKVYEIEKLFSDKEC